MYIVENTDGKTIKEINGTNQLTAQNITTHFRDETGETHYLMEKGICIFTAYADGSEELSDDISMWEEDTDYEDTDDYDELSDDDYDDEPYDPFDEVGYDPYTGGYNSDL